MHVVHLRVCLCTCMHVQGDAGGIHGPQGPPGPKGEPGVGALGYTVSLCTTLFIL